MNNRYKIAIIFMLSLFSFSVIGQSKKLKKASKKYQQFEYIDATEIYKQVAESGFTSEELLVRLSNGLFFNSKYKEASKWYKKLYTLKNGDLHPKLLLRYAQTLRVIGKEEESKDIYNEFLKSAATEQEDFASAADYLDIIEKNSSRYIINELPINSKKYIDFGTHYKQDTIYFASTRGYRRRIGRIDTWTNQPFLDIYYAILDSVENSYSKPKLLKGEVNSKHHESTPVITRDGSTMYFTRSNSTPLYDKKKNPIAHLKIYKATKNEKGEWENITDLSINGEHFSNAHPVLSPKEEKLYFVSNRPGGKGQTDIYYVDIFKSGNLGKPVNLGSKVNTKGRESFPFISRDYELYFSSDGHFGLGGYDVFYIDLKSKDMQLINLGKPINGEKDDYAFSINSVSKKGYFTSNRGKSDNIFSLIETSPIQDLLEIEVSGVVVDKKTGEILPNAKVTLRNKKDEVVVSLTTNNEGEFSSKINRYQPFTVRAEKEDYLPEDVFVYKKQKDPKVKIELEKNLQKIEQGIDIAKILNVVIYFDFDKSDIREDAKVELEKIVAVLQKYPQIQLDLRAHTDSKGESEYNRELSYRRAMESMQYLMNRGISKERLSAQGFGESELVNKCKDEIECSEEEHQENRRTEFVIKKELN